MSGSRWNTSTSVNFAKGGPGHPADPGRAGALAREAARKLGVPNAENTPLYRVGRNSHTDEAFAYVEWRWEGLG